MTLQNYSYNFKWKHKINNIFEFVSGFQGLMQSDSNDLSAEQVLVADANFYDFGAYTSLIGNLNQWNLQVGTRYDQRNVITFENIDPFSKNFNGFNYSIGISRSSKKFTTRLNASSGFRPPHISELLANGVHHATAQYLIGDENLNSEQANQLDFYLGMHQEHFEIIVNHFINQINNFVYNNPTGSND